MDEGMSVLDASEDTFHKTLDVNRFGAFRLCGAFLTLIRNSGRGRIVNVTPGKVSFAEMQAGQRRIASLRLR